MKAHRLLSGLCLAAALSAAGQPLVVDKAHSRVEVAVKATVDSFVATLSDYDASIVLDSTTGQVRTATFGFRFIDVLTGKKDRDREMLQWEDADHFPGGRFELISIENSPASAHLAKGRLTLHGVTRELVFPVAITTDHPRIAIDGTVTVDTRDFGLEVIRKFVVLKVDPKVEVRFHLQASTAAP